MSAEKKSDSNSKSFTAAGDGGPAFPSTPTPESFLPVARGMSLLDWFAGQALNGLLAGQGAAVGEDFELLEAAAWKIAQRMLALRPF